VPTLRLSVSRKSFSERTANSHEEESREEAFGRRSALQTEAHFRRFGEQSAGFATETAVKSSGKAKTTSTPTLTTSVRTDYEEAFGRRISSTSGDRDIAGEGREPEVVGNGLQVLEMRVFLAKRL